MGSFDDLPALAGTPARLTQPGGVLSGNQGVRCTSFSCSFLRGGRLTVAATDRPEWLPQGVAVFGGVPDGGQGRPFKGLVNVQEAVCLQAFNAAADRVSTDAIPRWPPFVGQSEAVAEAAGGEHH